MSNEVSIFMWETLPILVGVLCFWVSLKRDGCEIKAMMEAHRKDTEMLVSIVDDMSQVVAVTHVALRGLRLDDARQQRLDDAEKRRAER